MPRQSHASLSYPSTLTRTERVGVPPELDDNTRAVFLSIVNSAPAHAFTESDTPLLSAYAASILIEREAAQKLAEQNLVTDSNKINAWVAVHHDAVKTMLSLARTLRVTPRARKPYQDQPSRASRQASYYDLMNDGVGNGADGS